MGPYKKEAKYESKNIESLSGAFLESEKQA